MDYLGLILISNRMCAVRTLSILVGFVGRASARLVGLKPDLQIAQLPFLGSFKVPHSQFPAGWHGDDLSRSKNNSSFLLGVRQNRAPNKHI